ncbi:HEAT repeat domain-containing protein [Nodosilinea nodulosa]|uniref:HEAT repeat domain-containing protein n=1 Tax=Nodosilinea nodulosa TaxID=416001 RepID=UPI0002DC6F24|nr:HEAT repeat domain-containing protein [Nodosilinea nodulosa]
MAYLTFLILLIGLITVFNLVIKPTKRRKRKSRFPKHSRKTYRTSDASPILIQDRDKVRVNSEDDRPDLQQNTGPSSTSSVEEITYPTTQTFKPPVRERDRVWFNTEDDRPSFQQDVGPSSTSSIEELTKYLNCGNNPEFRRLAAKLLGQMGADAVSAISPLLIACVDISKTVRKEALNALQLIDPCWPKNSEVYKVFPRLAEEFKYSYCFQKAYSEDVSQAAYKLLQQIGKPAVFYLANLIVEEGDKIEYKVRAIQVLADIGADAESAVPQLIQALNSKSSQVRMAAAKALVNFGSFAKAAIPSLIVGLGDRDADVRKAMTACLAATEPAVPELLPLLGDRNPNVRRAVANVLAQTGPQTVPMLTEIVSHWCAKSKDYNDEFEKHQRMAEAALHLLGKFGSHASVAAPTIALALADPNSNIKLAAIQTLEKLGPQASAAMPSIALMLLDPDPNTKFTAFRLLENIDRNWMSNSAVIDAIAGFAGQSSKSKKPEEIARDVFAQAFAAIDVNKFPTFLENKNGLGFH